MFTRILPLCLALIPTGLLAQSLQGITFAHQDWELACDNTGTCRAAGYQADEDEAALPFSILLTRAAGADAPITGEIQPALYRADNSPISIHQQQGELLLNQQSLGKVQFKQQANTAALTPTQTQAIVAALVQPNSHIEFRSGKEHWQLSDKGAAAVFLKMDEFQQRLHTPNALIRKGNRHTPVLAARPIPILRVPKVPSGTFTPLARNSRTHQRLLQKLRHTINSEQCPQLHDTEFEQYITLAPLNSQKTLVEATCQTYAYNYDNLYVIMNPSLNTIQTVLPAGNNGYSNSSGVGELSATHKIRGIGDCWHNTTQVWKGKQFIPSQTNSNSLCRGFAGGAWHMPSLITHVTTQ